MTVQLFQSLEDAAVCLADDASARAGSTSAAPNNAPEVNNEAMQQISRDVEQASGRVRLHIRVGDEAGGASAPPTSNADDTANGEPEQPRDTGTAEDVTMDNDQEGPHPGPPV